MVTEADCLSGLSPYGTEATRTSHRFDAPRESIVLSTRKLTKEEELLVERAFNEPFEASARLQETAKLLSAVVMASAGIVVAGFAALYSLRPVPMVFQVLTCAALACWAASFVAFLFAHRARSYDVLYNTPDGLRRAFTASRRTTFRWLAVGAIFYFSGLALLLAGPLVDAV